METTQGLGEVAAPAKRSTCKFCKKWMPRDHECAAKAAAMAERPCKYPKCGKPFTPAVYGQAYCCHNHKRMNRNQAEYRAKLKRLGKERTRPGPKEGYKSEINTIAPLERRWQRAEKQASTYAPVMGDALVDITLQLMGAT